MPKSIRRRQSGASSLNPDLGDPATKNGVPGRLGMTEGMGRSLGQEFMDQG